MPVHRPLNPAGYVMFETVRETLPELPIVSTCFETCPVVTLPKARDPDTRRRETPPTPEQGMVEFPEVASEYTVMLLL